MDEFVGEAFPPGAPAEDDVPPGREGAGSKAARAFLGRGAAMDSNGAQIEAEADLGR
jgi:hypothetical protein